MMNSKPSIDDVWRRIEAAQGEEFTTKTGKPFTYEVSGNTFYPGRTDYAIGKKDFETVLELVPVDGPGKISRLVRGPAYVWAVMHDRRIRGKDW